MSQQALQGKKIILDEVRQRQPFRVWFLTGFCSERLAIYHRIWRTTQQQIRCRQHDEHAG